MFLVNIMHLVATCLAGLVIGGRDSSHRGIGRSRMGFDGIWARRNESRFRGRGRDRDRRFGSRHDSRRSSMSKDSSPKKVVKSAAQIAREQAEYEKQIREHMESSQKQEDKTEELRKKRWETLQQLKEDHESQKSSPVPTSQTTYNHTENEAEDSTNRRFSELPDDESEKSTTPILVSSSNVSPVTGSKKPFTKLIVEMFL
eukprot:TRINITY_DN9640_c0_g1_i1.p1 TRINITY_DN9640_c0_g1~~TRINITY_DN9640_c0_g1_i1.p1  ORF type:complete len:201 (+),score=32.03 TRINITY_DN9640_c0_g1_i1:345-947(+)